MVKSSAIIVLLLFSLEHSQTTGVSWASAVVVHVDMSFSATAYNDGKLGYNDGKLGLIS